MTGRFLTFIGLLVFLPGLLPAQEPVGSATAGASPARSYPFVSMLGIGAGYGTPYGDGARGEESGLLVAGDLRLAVGATTYLALRYRKQQMDRWQYAFRDEIDLSYREYDIRIDQHQYLFTIGFLSSPEVGRRTCWYVEIGLSYTSNQYRSELTESSAPLWYIPRVGFVSETTQQRFGAAGQIGILVPFGADSNLGLDANVSLLSEIVGESNYNVFEDSPSSSVGVQAGIYLALGRP